MIPKATSWVLVGMMSMGLSMSAQSMPSGTNAGRIKVIHQPRSPIDLDQFESKDNTLYVVWLFTSQSDRRIVAARLGWFVVPKDRNLIPHIGEETKFPFGVRPGQSATLKALRVPGLLADYAVNVVFFVAEVQYDDGEKWKTDTAALKSEVERALRKKVATGQA